MALDPTIPVWPRWLAPTHIVPPGPSVAPMEGPLPLVGSAQSVSQISVPWQMQYVEVPIYPAQTAGGLDRIATFRALASSRLSKGLPVLVPLYDWRRGPRARAGVNPFGAIVTGLSDGTMFSDGTGFSQPSPDAVMARAANVGDTTIYLTMPGPAVLDGGDYFSIDDRVYLAEGVWQDASVSTLYKVQISRGLLYAVAANYQVEIADPVMRARLAPSERKTLIQYTNGLIARVSLTWQEANWSA